jgi:hypothetical protein
MRTAAGLGENRRQPTRIGGVAATEVLRFRRAQLAFGSLAQQIQLFRLQLAQIARFLVENQRAIADAADFLNKVADFLKHLAQFAVAAFDQNHFVPGIIALTNLADAGRRGAYLCRAGLAALDRHATTENVQLSLAWLTGDLDQISFFHARGCLGKPVGQIAVVSDHEQPLALVVEAANGIEALLHLVKELHHCGPAFRVLDRGDEALGLVEDEVAQALWTLQQLAVHADVIAARIRLGPQFGDNLAVDLDAALLDHPLGAAAAGHAGSCQDLLQPLQLGRRTRLGREFAFRLAFGLRGVFRLKLGSVFSFCLGFFRFRFFFHRILGLCLRLGFNGRFNLGFRRGF